jgi:Flp pilus assembly protein TadB
MIWQNYISPIAAGLIALIAYGYFKNVDLTFGRSASSRLEQFASMDRRGITDRIGDSLMDRFGLTFESLEQQLRWANLGGFYEGKTIGSAIGKSLLYGSVGLTYIVLFKAFSPIFLVGILIAAYYPILSLKGRAEDSRQMVKRALPEAAALIAAEMSAGGSAETAVTRASSLPGPLGKLINDVMQTAQSSGRLIFSRDTIEGVMVEKFTIYKSPHLEAFARQIDLVASKGAEGPKQMGEVARGLAREYRSDVAKSAEQLSNKLLVPITLYIFIPFMLAIFIPLFASVFQSF